MASPLTLNQADVGSNPASDAGGKDIGSLAGFYPVRSGFDSPTTY